MARSSSERPRHSPKGRVMNVKDKVCVVTGGASGIGLALCTRFAQEGAHVVLSDLSQEACERAGRADRRAARSPPTSAARRTSRNLVATTIDHFGRIDLFVSNAGIGIDGGIDTPTDKWQKIINVNLMSEVFAAPSTRSRTCSSRAAATCSTPPRRPACW